MGLVQRGKQIAVQILNSELAVEALDKAVLHGLARGDVMPVNLGRISPVQNGITGKLGCIASAWAMRAALAANITRRARSFAPCQSKTPLFSMGGATIVYWKWLSKTAD
jgi:hypothetical protein